MSQSVIHFWFNELTPKQWWAVDAELDKEITQRFSTLLQQAVGDELAGWRQSAQGRLAEIIVLDQFSRNIHRGTPQAFSQDPMALALAQEAVAAGSLAELNDAERPFLLMPYMHSESIAIHEQAMLLFAEHAPNNLDFEKRHKAIVDRFGRYPHRNNILGRESSAEEIEFLKQPGSSF